MENAYYVSQLVGVVAVVVSVLYLAKQVKASNNLNRTSTFRTIFQGLASFTNEVFGARNAELMIKGYRDFQSLSLAEKTNFDLSLANFFNRGFRSWVDEQAKSASQDDVDGIKASV